MALIVCGVGNAHINVFLQKDQTQENIPISISSYIIRVQHPNVE